MKQCPTCGAMHDDRQPACPVCGTDLTRLPSLAPPPPVPPVPSFRPAALYPHPRAYTWADVCIILGFSAGVIGYFWAGVLLLPVGLIFSLLGFHSQKTRGLAVAGTVISAIGLVVKLLTILNEVGILPDWLIDGIWW